MAELYHLEFNTEEISSLRDVLAAGSTARESAFREHSIAHEVNQPLTGIITNAKTCLRMLAAAPQTLTARARPRSARFATATVRRM